MLMDLHVFIIPMIIMQNPCVNGINFDVLKKFTDFEYLRSSNTITRIRIDLEEGGMRLIHIFKQQLRHRPSQLGLAHYVIPLQKSPHWMIWNAWPPWGFRGGNPWRPLPVFREQIRMVVLNWVINTLPSLRISTVAE